MINERSINAIDKSSSKSLCKPLYDSYCFSRIPGTIRYLLSGQKEKVLPADTFIQDDYDTIVLFFIDGFGWHFFEKFKDRSPFLSQIERKGIVSKLTSQFPSTTAPHVTCINTGLTTSESGIYEWFYYEPLVDRVITPLLFSYAGDHVSGTLKESGISFEKFYPTHTIYEKLNSDGIISYVMQNTAISHSPYSMAMLRGSFSLPYTSINGALKTLKDLINQRVRNKRYIFLYFGDIDSAGHRHGIHSHQFEDAITSFWKQMEGMFCESLQLNERKIACLITADHGMVDINPKKTFYLNQEFPEIERFLKQNKKGELIVPAGSCRDFFLHIQDDRLLESHEIVQEILQEKAKVVFTEDLIRNNFFGATSPSEDFLKRVGNLVILPREGECVWWYKKHRFEQHFFGAHGGLTKHEMEIPFLFLPLIP